MYPSTSVPVCRSSSKEAAVAIIEEAGAGITICSLEELDDKLAIYREQEKGASGKFGSEAEQRQIPSTLFARYNILQYKLSFQQDRGAKS